MADRVLVIGATGMLGEPVARQLASAGRRVRVLSRDADRARARFGGGFEAVTGDVDHVESLRRAVDGCSGVHLNLAGHGDWDLERRGADNASRVARELGVGRLTMISGASTCEDNAWFAGTRAKLEAERAVAASGVPYTIFRCTMFMELLPTLVKDGRAMVMGKQPTPWRWVAAADYAAMVAGAYDTADAANKILYVCGPERLTFEQAMTTYQASCAPDAKLTRVPFPVLRIISWFPSRADLRRVGLPIMRYFSRVTEVGEPDEANALLGAPRTTLAEWCARRG